MLKFITNDPSGESPIALALRRRKLLLASPQRVYSVYWGPGAYDRCRDLGRRSGSALRSPWGSWVLGQTWLRPLPICWATRATKPREDTETTTILDQLRALCRGAAKQPLAATIPWRRLQRVLGRSFLVARWHLFHDLWRNDRLPLGPSHGDVHVGNVLSLHGQCKLCDWDRFRPAASPWFDLLQWQLSQLQGRTGGPWLQVLLDHPELAEETDCPAELFYGRCLAYALIRCADQGAAHARPGRAATAKWRQRYRSLIDGMLIAAARQRQALPGFSVVIPTCDRPELLQRCLRSVQQQQQQPVEVIVVDNGRQPIAQPQIPGLSLRVIRLPARSGVSTARNAGMWLSRGTYVAFLDDDDTWEPGYLAHIQAAQRRGEATSIVNMLIGREDLRSPNGPLPYKCVRKVSDLLPALLERNPGVGGPVMVVHRESLWQVGGFDDVLRTAEDRALVVDALRLRWQIICVPEAVSLISRDEGKGHLTASAALGRGKRDFLTRYRRGMTPWRWLQRRFQLVRLYPNRWQHRLACILRPFKQRFVAR